MRDRPPPRGSLFQPDGWNALPPFRPTATVNPLDPQLPEDYVRAMHAVTQEILVQVERQSYVAHAALWDIEWVLMQDDVDDSAKLLMIQALCEGARRDG